MTGLVRSNGAMPTGQEIDTAVRIAQNLAASGMFKDARQAEQAFAKIMLGRDLGLSPTMAMTSIYVVEGKPELSANLQAQLVKTYAGPEGERYDYLVLEHTGEVCVIEFRRREKGGSWEPLGTERFTIEDAKAAGLVRPNSPWTKYPRNMLWARALSNGVNFHCPEVARGLRVFHEGELTNARETPQFVVDDDPITHHAVDAVDAIELVGDIQRAEILGLLKALHAAGAQGLMQLLIDNGATDSSSFTAAAGSLPASSAANVIAGLRTMPVSAAAQAAVTELRAMTVPQADDGDGEEADRWPPGEEPSLYELDAEARS